MEWRLERVLAPTEFSVLSLACLVTSLGVGKFLFPLGFGKLRGKATAALGDAFLTACDRGCKVSCWCSQVGDVFVNTPCGLPHCFGHMVQRGRGSIESSDLVFKFLDFSFWFHNYEIGLVKECKYTNKNGFCQ